jgi:hypothetical protein
MIRCQTPESRQQQNCFHTAVQGGRSPWEEVPLHTGPELVENGVGDPPPQMLLRSATPRRIAWRIKETFDLCPLQVRSVAYRFPIRVPTRN